MNKLLLDSIKLAIDAHGEQIDKSGELYILHPLAVMHIVKDLGIEYQITAVLHDILEDTIVRLWELEEGATYGLKLPKNILEALDLLTHQEGQKYETYAKRILNSGNELAIKVKTADWMHNISRLDKIKDEKERLRLFKKYNTMVGWRWSNE